jgi:hypothetical protein
MNMMLEIPCWQLASLEMRFKEKREKMPTTQSDEMEKINCANWVKHPHEIQLAE